ncbi:MAG: hypothetical protein QY314_04885 [Candidatus Dojkabacteria bacterium]|nr:MAG: hypothetical protein QY314_04885 [Candidatus Dojkabacteria bacterium]
MFDREKSRDIVLPQEFDRELLTPLSVPIEGTMYSSSLLIAEEGTLFVKTLRPDVTNRFRGMGATLDEFFDHQEATHHNVARYMDDESVRYMLPSTFCRLDQKGEQSFHIVQPYATGGVQYKQFRDTSQTLPQSYLPSFEERVDFAHRIGSLQNETRKLLDLDFFIVGAGVPHIIVFDATFMWYDKREGKDKSEQGYNLVKFLFPVGEERDPDQERLVIDVRKHLMG